MSLPAGSSGAASAKPEASAKAGLPAPVRAPLGVCTSVFGHRQALSAEKLRALAETGIPWIEISALQIQHLDVFDEERVEELAEASRRHGLRVWSLHAQFCGLAMDDADTRQDALRKLLKAGWAAQRFGATRVVVHPGRDVASADRRRELGWLRDGLARAVDRLPAGLALALETMGPRTLAGPAEEMLEVLAGLDHRRVGICLDVGHVHVGGDPAAYARAVGPRIVSVHLHDNFGDRDAHALPGEGSIDWRACLRAIREAGYAGAWISEAGSETLSPREAVREYIRRMDRLLGG